ncbi:MAG TPA: RAMP superfamily protein [Chloroflexi bacterium]|nr:RAMP superfamily protein [Chloroflexota bacterium]
MIDLKLRITLLSDTTFGRGDGVAGLVDAEVQHDAAGCPFLFGRTIKGMLREECVNLLYALEQAAPAMSARWAKVVNALLGAPGSSERGRAALVVDDARIAADLHQAIAWQVANGALRRAEVLDAFTAIRQQTAVDAERGAPRDETLRAARVILRDTVFWAALHIDERRLDAHQVSSADALMLLAAVISGWRRAGASRNRGRGEIAAALFETVAGSDVECTQKYLGAFAAEVMPS